MIHPTAIVHPGACIDPTCEVGPYVIVDAGVVMGAGCVVGPHAHLTGELRVGARNRFHAGCVIGDAPQDVKYEGAPTRLTIGDGNVFREHVTVHRSNRVEEETRIGSANLLMAHCHVGHNARIGDRVIVANGAQIGGHVEIGDGAFISGNCVLHQFVRVGGLAFMQGGAGISKDLPPFTVAWGDNALGGLNIVGLRRAGMPGGVRTELRRLYRRLFWEAAGPRRAAALLAADGGGLSGPARALVEFVLASRRGVCVHRRRGRREPAAGLCGELGDERTEAKPYE